jgi:hypothetical protein
MPSRKAEAHVELRVRAYRTRFGRWPTPVELRLVVVDVPEIDAAGGVSGMA